MFRIKCRVSGGVTGTREAYLKEKGEEVTFYTEESANTVARNLNNQMGVLHATASFKYTVEPC